MEAPVSHKLFAKIIRDLLRIIIEQRRDFELLNRVVAATTPLPLAKYEELRLEAAKNIEPLLKTIAETPDDKMLEFLRSYQGTVQ
jgi:hypothetical protein